MLIGLIGKKGVGKDTVADYLVETRGYQKLAYADPLKSACRELFSFSEEQLNGNLKEEIDPYWKVSPRQVFQFVGTELFRNEMKRLIPDIENNFWISCMERRLLSLLKTEPLIQGHKGNEVQKSNIVVSDLRFPNEVELIKKHGGMTIKIIRPESESPKLSSINFHSSEILTESLKSDFILQNFSTKDSLFQEMNSILKSILHSSNLPMNKE